MAANYEEIIWELLSSGPWTFAKKEVELNLLSSTPTSEWAYVYQAPSDLLEIVRVYQSGEALPYEKNGSKIYCDASNDNTPVYIEYIVRIATTSWPGQFRALVIQRLESLCLRALNEDYNNAVAVGRDSQFTERNAKNRDSNNQTPRRKRSSRLTRIRRA